MKIFIKTVLLVMLFIATLYPTNAKEVGFTQQDRERLIKLETTLKLFMESTNKHFEMMQKQMDERFDAVNKRFEDINKRFEDINKRFEDINKRFEDVNKRFEEIITILQIIVAAFVSIVAITIGFALWDRRTFIKKAKEETIQYLETEGKIKLLIEILKEKAKTDKELADILRQFNLL